MLQCCSGYRSEWADEVKLGVVIKRLEAASWFLVATRGSPVMNWRRARCEAFKSSLDFSFDEIHLRRGD